MAYKQYTRCVAPERHRKQNQYLGPTVFALPLLVGGLLAAAFSGRPFLSFPVLEAAVCEWLIVYTNWWHRDRLVCLGGDEVAAGLLLSLEAPQSKRGFDRFDSDFSLDLLLPATRIGASQAEAEKSEPLGWLIREQPSITALGLPFSGEEGADSTTAILHVEFEGGGMKTLQLFAFVGLGAAAVVFLIGWLSIPGWAILVFCAVLLVVLPAAAWAAASLAAADPRDVDPDLTDFHPHFDGQGRELPGNRDVVVVAGAWVYDAGHTDHFRGWNELHPVKRAKRFTVKGWDGSLPPEAEEELRRWREQAPGG